MEQRAREVKTPTGAGRTVGRYTLQARVTAARVLLVLPMNALAQDIRYGWRAWLATPGLASVALLSLALGIGATTAIFSVASALLLRPLPYRDADRLVILWNTSPGLGITEDWFSTAQYFDIKSSTRSFDQVAIAIGANFNLTGDGEPERVGTLRVSANLLPMLGARVELGRLLVADDDRPGRPGVALLGHGTWVRRFGGDRKVIGRTVMLNGQPFEIVGVLPASFDLPREVMPTLGGAEHAELVIPLPLPDDAARVRNREDYNIVARLAPGASIEQARAEMDSLTARLRREHPDFYPPNGGLTFVVLPLQQQVVGGVRRALLVLQGAVACVLLIACANVANLLLGRALGRRTEIAVRAALGAGRSRVVRQLLTESMLLAAAGGVLGVGLSFLFLHGIRTLGQASIPRLHEISIDLRVLVFAAVTAMASGMLFGLAPAWRLSRLDLHEHLKGAGRALSGANAVWGRGQGLRRLLVVAEVALAVVLFIGAGLLVGSFSRLQQVPPGFDPDNVLTFELTMTGRKYGNAQAVLGTYKQLWERLGRLPGVTATGGVSALPLSQMMAWGPITVDGRTPPAGEKFLNADQRVVSGDYFRAMRIPLMAGRLFTDHDTAEAPPVVVVDEHMASQLWPGGTALGKRIRTGGFDVTGDTPWMTVVGVVGRVKQDGLDSDPRIAFYRAHAQFPTRALTVVLRSQVEPAALTRAATHALRQIDPDLPVYGARTMKERVDRSLARRRFSTLLLSLFAAVALGLAVVGVYGVVAFLVNQGRRDIGIRLALGATPPRILSLVVRHGVALALGGIAIGLLAAAVLARFMESLLFGIAATDWRTFAAAALVLTAIAALASLVPALRAAKVDPTQSLRSE